jgi:non-canonical purine NTP pyrophosphatase (RdgB/HAM1 family)
LTFKANAGKKALSASKRVDKLVMAEDSGLEVFALGKRPGVNSARYAGLSQDDNKNNAKLLERMEGFSGRKRNARFVCSICLAKGKRIVKIVEGKVGGRIALHRAGNFGFGYDCVFIPNGYDKTFGRLGSRVKDRISHRAAALKKAKEAVKIYFQKCS